MNRKPLSAKGQLKFYIKQQQSKCKKLKKSLITPQKNNYFDFSIEGQSNRSQFQTQRVNSLILQDNQLLQNKRYYQNQSIDSSLLDEQFKNTLADHFQNRLNQVHRKSKSSTWSIDQSTKQKFRNAIQSLDYKAKELIYKRDGQKGQESKQQMMEAVIQGNDLDDQIQQHLKQYHQRKNLMINTMETKIMTINKFVQNYEKTGRQSIRASTAFKNSSRRQGLLDSYNQRKQSISVFQIVESENIEDLSSQKQQTEEDEIIQEKCNIEDENFILQFLSVNQKEITQKEDYQQELKMQQQKYWSYDKKGRNIKELQELTEKRQISYEKLNKQKERQNEKIWKNIQQRNLNLYTKNEEGDYSLFEKATLYENKFRRVNE